MESQSVISLESFIVLSVDKWDIDAKIKKINIKAKTIPIILPENRSKIYFIELMQFNYIDNIPVIIERESYFKSFDYKNKFLEESYFNIVCGKCVLHFWRRIFESDSLVGFFKIFSDLDKNMFLS